MSRKGVYVPKAYSPARNKIKRDDRVYDRSLTDSRMLATRFYIWALERALSAKNFPRDASLFKIEMEFKPSRMIGANVPYKRRPLAERLCHEYKRIAYGRKSPVSDTILMNEVESWMRGPGIKEVLAERILVGDA